MATWWASHHVNLQQSGAPMSGSQKIAAIHGFDVRESTSHHPTRMRVRNSLDRTGMALALIMRTGLTQVAIALSLAVAITFSAQAADSERVQHKSDVWYVATSPEIVDRMVDLARVRPGDVVYDLGCGDGRMVIAAAKKFGTRGVGVDIDPALIRVARANAKAQGVDDLVTFKVENLFETDLREATVVMMYLLPAVNQRLKPKLFAELRPGARVVSHNWDMGAGWPADRAVHLGHETIYLWIMPEPKDTSRAQH